MNQNQDQKQNQNQLRIAYQNQSIQLGNGDECCFCLKQHSSIYIPIKNQKYNNKNQSIQAFKHAKVKHIQACKIIHN